ncbi:MAG: hypothetical protein KGD63_15180 [Candidatus Lokiarchaeota archaeon]|nr:hypothetical protein [Candidatus Lokiarchaeota archaeon]
MEDKEESYIDAIKKDLKKKIINKVKNEILQDIYKEIAEKDDILTDEVISLLDKKISSNSVVKKKNFKPQKETLPKQQKKYECTISVQTILKTAAHALKYANSNIPREKWIEVIGLLAGKLDKNKILHLEDAYPMGHGTAITVKIRNPDNHARAFKEIQKNKQFICGWYHSHPSYGLFMSKEDVGTQSVYQRLWDKAVALVIDPYQINGKSFGFKMFRADLNNGNWNEVPFMIKGAVDVSVLPEFLKFINPLTEGKALFLEYDEE